MKAWILALSESWSLIWQESPEVFVPMPPPLEQVSKGAIEGQIPTLTLW